MSIKMMAAVYDSELTDVFEVAVMLALANHADDTGRACYPSVARLCRLTRMKERGVQYVLRRLQARGYLSLEGGGGRARTNRYVINAKPGSGCSGAIAPEPTTKEEPVNPASGAPFCANENPAPGAPFQENPAPGAPFDSLNPAPGAPETSVSKNEGGGGSAHTRTHEPARGATVVALRRSDPSSGAIDVPLGTVQDPTDRERLLEAMGHDHTGLTATGRLVGNAEDMLEAGRWGSELDLSLEEQLEVVRSVMSGKRDGLPVSFRYFRQAMKRLSDRKREPSLRTTTITTFQGNREVQRARKVEETKSILAYAARGASSDWRPGMPDDGHVPFADLRGRDENASPKAREAMRIIMLAAKGTGDNWRPGMQVDEDSFEKDEDETQPQEQSRRETGK